MFRRKDNFAQMTQQLHSMLVAGNGQYDLQLRTYFEQRARDHKNPFCQFGNKCFSQADEDGLIFEIARRLELTTGTFVEFGVGDGMENNTLALVASNWRGEWFGGQDLAFDTAQSKKLTFTKSWIDRDNIVDLTQSAMARLQVSELDLISLDLDGNDYYFIDEILSAGIKPKVFIAEYNAKFIPPIEFTIPYDPTHSWGGDDYFGVSLALLDKHFTAAGYTLICCNAATGANAFFVRSEYADRFPEVPARIQDIYTPPNYNLHQYFGHPPSVKTVLQCL